MEIKQGKDKFSKAKLLNKRAIFPSFFTLIDLSETKVGQQFPELFNPGSGGKSKKKGPNKNKSAFQPLKNPCLALNELKPGLEYKLLEQTGPVHMPKFKIAIELDGQTFTGEGR